MKDSSKVFDELCKKLEPHVRSAMIDVPMERDEIPEVSDINIDTEELYNFMLDEAPEPDPKERENLRKELCEALGPSFNLHIERSDVEEEWLKLCVDILATTWSETLNLTSKGQNTLRLRDCLLPENLGRAERAWNVNTNRLGLTQEQIENLLRNFAKAELEKGIQLPWGGFVTRDTDGPVLISSKE